jgi:hypothetical protein
MNSQRISAASLDAYRVLAQISVLLKLNVSKEILVILSKRLDGSSIG